MNNNEQEVFYLENLSFRYPFSNKEIKINGTLSINHGECVLIKGASGSGKSTLLMAFKGLIPHLINGKLTGKLLFHNQDIIKLKPQEVLKIGYLQQNPDSQLICHTVFDELAFGLENLALDATTIHHKIMAIADRFAIKNLLFRKPATLSGGQKQTINLISILLLEPEVLLLDEPTAFLDPESAQIIVAILKEYTQEKVVIIIEHNYHYLTGLVNRIVNIDSMGNIEEQRLDIINHAEPLPNLVNLNVNCGSPLLSINNLTFNYPNAENILSNLTLTINEGEIIGIVGKNGCGKSTLLKLIAGVMPSNQQIIFNNLPIEKVNKVQLWQKISILWQNPEAHFIYNQVSQELNSDLKLATMLDLAGNFDSSPFNLSEGQKRRLSIGIVTKQKPQLLLLDEPTFGQDHNNKLKLAQIVAELAHNGTAVLIISHDLDFISALTTKIYQLKNKGLVLWQR